MLVDLQVLNHVRLSCKATYKLAMRNAYMSFEDKCLMKCTVTLSIKEFQSSGSHGMLTLKRMPIMSTVILVMWTSRMNLLCILRKCFAAQMMMFRHVVSIFINVQSVCR